MLGVLVAEVGGGVRFWASAPALSSAHSSRFKLPLHFYGAGASHTAGVVDACVAGATNPSATGAALGAGIAEVLVLVELLENEGPLTGGWEEGSAAHHAVCVP